MEKFVCGENRCAGCMACVEKCPVNAVTIKDTLSEYNAVIDTAKCIDCDACRKVCQVENPPKLSYPVYWKEGWAADEDIRKKSSSGGYAAAIERAFVKNGGVVCSCCASEDGFGFGFAETEDEINRFIGSKYVKSNPFGAYKKIKKFINDGKKVLFLGLPCQSAAVKNYIGENELLYTADLICHGTPSPKLLESYLKDFGKDLSSCADKLSFRSSNIFRLEENGKPFVKPVVKDDYTFLFLKAAIYTENCFNCRYAATERVSDLTLGDSWGTELPKDEASKGVSLALCQNEKGVELLKNADIKLMDTDLELAVKYNHQLKHPSIKPEGSERFFGVIKKGGSFKNAFKKTYPKVWGKNKAKLILKRG